ncbi:hypothetical protein C8R43DRAFT_502863 [Mycena crocata]|nr:hypothetical protein C8R43DRAFT_502863 [Mycena crocata]
MARPRSLFQSSSLTMCAGCLFDRSGSLDEVSGALYTLMATNAAMAVTGLILGLKSNPETSFQDAVVNMYLLSMAWITVIASLASCNRLSAILQLVSVIQSCVIVSFAFAAYSISTRAHVRGTVYMRMRVFVDEFRHKNRRAQTSHVMRFNRMNT